MKIGVLSSAADENNFIFVGLSGRRKYAIIFVGFGGRRKYVNIFVGSEQYFRWPLGR
jgi:hypothetical protein